MIKNWFKLNIEIEMRSDFNLSEMLIYYGKKVDKKLFKVLKEFWWHAIPLESVLSPQWISNYAEILTVKELTIFYWSKNYSPIDTHIDWRRRWGINWVTQPDGRLMTWYNEIPTKYYDAEPDIQSAPKFFKNYSHLTPIKDLTLTDQLCFDQGVNQPYFLRTDIPHHIGPGEERFGFSLADYSNWDIPFRDMLYHYRQHGLIIEREISES